MPSITVANLLNTVRILKSLQSNPYADSGTKDVVGSILAKLASPISALESQIAGLASKHGTPRGDGKHDFDETQRKNYHDERKQVIGVEIDLPKLSADEAALFNGLSLRSLLALPPEDL